jgi:hypothetical protein
MFEGQKGWKCSKTLNFLKKVKYFFDLYLIDLIEFIFLIGKILAFFRKKSAKGVDDPK